MALRKKLLVCGKNSACATGMSILASGLPDWEIIYGYSGREAPKALALPLAVAKAEGLGTRAISDRAALTDIVAELDPDLLVSIQFSLIIPAAVIAHGCGRIVNVHFSPLPRYRGMAPITLALSNGDETFGVTLHLVDAGIDTGPILDQEMFDIRGLTNIEVYQVCERASDDLLKRNLPLFAKAVAPAFLEAHAMPQSDAFATYFSRSDMDYSQRVLCFDRSAAQVESRARALHFPPTLYPQVTASGHVYTVLSPPRIGERCFGHRPGQVGAPVPLTMASRDRWLIFDDVRVEDDDQ